MYYIENKSYIYVFCFLPGFARNSGEIAEMICTTKGLFLGREFRLPSGEEPKNGWGDRKENF